MQYNGSMRSMELTNKKHPIIYILYVTYFTNTLQTFSLKV